MDAKKLVNEIVADNFGMPDCKECGLGSACVGCPAAHQYMQKIKPFKEALGSHVVSKAEELVVQRREVKKLEARLTAVNKERERLEAQLASMISADKLA